MAKNKKRYELRVIKHGRVQVHGGDDLARLQLRMIEIFNRDREVEIACVDTTIGVAIGGYRNGETWDR